MSGYRPPYTLGEQKKILRYIIDNNQQHFLRGRRCWQEFEKTQAIDRTWQSSKEHFLKKIYPMLDHPMFELTAAEIIRIKEGMNDTKRAPQFETNGPPPRSNSERAQNIIDLNNIIDSSDEDN